MSSDESYKESKEKLMTLNILKLNFEKFESLESMRNYLLENNVEVSVANLSRYLNGKAIPKSKLKNQLLEVLLKEGKRGVSIEELIKKNIEVFSDSSGNVGIINSNLLKDLNILKAVLFLALKKEIIPKDIDKVLCKEVESIPIAMVLAELLNVDCLYARREKPIGKVISHSEDILAITSGRIETLYLPENSIVEEEKILIITDVNKSGATIKALTRLVEKFNAIPYKAVSLISLGSHWDDISEYEGIAFNSLYSVGT